MVPAGSRYFIDGMLLIHNQRERSYDVEDMNDHEWFVTAVYAIKNERKHQLFWGIALRVGFSDKSSIFYVSVAHTIN